MRKESKEQRTRKNGCGTLASSRGAPKHRCGRGKKRCAKRGGRRKGTIKKANAPQTQAGDSEDNRDHKTGEGEGASRRKSIGRGIQDPNDATAMGGKTHQ